MSNFETLGIVSNAIPGTAPNIFVASTVDSFGTITATGYLNDLGDKVKLNDLMYINYADLSVQPVGGGNANMSATFGLFQVAVAGSNVSLVSVGALSASSQFYFVDTTVGQAALASAGKVNLQVSTGTQQYKVRDLWINSGGTNFSGGGGDRNLAITDGTTVYSVIPATNLQTETNNGWGISTPLPYPAAAAINTSTVAGANLYAQYSGGTADYTAGSIVITAMLQRVA